MGGAGRGFGVRRVLLPLLLLSAVPAWAAPAAPARTFQAQALQERVEAIFAEAGPGPRFGLLVETIDGRTVVAIAPDQRFIPASNTKLFPTIAAFELLPQADQDTGARVIFEPARKGRPNLVLQGRGDGRLSSAPDCRTNCLAELANAVAARTRVVGDLIGDAALFPDERWSQGMSWNNIPTSSGTAMAALTLDRNEVALRVAPGAPGQPPRAELSPYFTLDNRALTSAEEGGEPLAVHRLPGSRRLLLTGTLEAATEERLIRLGIDDPAHHAAWQLGRMLEERGVRVTGRIVSRYREPGTGMVREEERGPAIAELSPGPLLDELTTINKVSQNLQAELLLRRLGLVRGQGSAAKGLEAIRSLLELAGVDPNAVTLADGSGMSTYNRVTPRATVGLLRWAAGRPWGAEFRRTLPIGGIDGTLARRFQGGALRGRIFAKTGSLNATNALAGYLLTRSGQTLVFAAYANDVPEGVRATLLIDRALEEVALSDGAVVAPAQQQQAVAALKAPSSEGIVKKQ